MDLSFDKQSCTLVWSALTGQLHEFSSAWDTTPEPDIAAFVPADVEQAEIRQIVLVELVKLDMQRRATAQCLRSLEAYLADFPELAVAGEFPLDLICEDYHVRHAAGHRPNVAEYLSRFSGQADELQRVLGDGRESFSSQLYRGDQLEKLGVGQSIDDFELLVELGKGAFGSVYLAKQVSMQRLVALKVTAFRGTEPQTLAQLDHPNIIRVFDQRRLPQQGILLMYMQLAPGGTLEEVVQQVQATPVAQRSGKILADCVIRATTSTTYIMMDEGTIRSRFEAMPWPEVVAGLGIQLAKALHYACQQGIMHRDIKPANVLLAVDGSSKLADFNISYCSQLEGTTPAAYFGGSLAYMSPEQLEAYDPSHPRRPQDLTGQSDLYSLAVLLWELLHGQRPFHDQRLAGGMSQTLAGMIARRRQREVVPSATANQSPLVQRLETIFLATLSSEPADRPVDGEALAKQLGLALRPRTWELVHGNTWWQQFARQHPLITYTLLTVPPFLIAGIYNFLYNKQAFIEGHAERAEGFWFTASWLNPVFYTFGMALVLIYVWPFAQTLKRVLRKETVTIEQTEQARLRSLRIGYSITLISLAEWLLAGIAFSIALDLPWQDSLRFILVQLTCGLVSLGLPFLSTTWAGLTIYFPALLREDTPGSVEMRQLAAIPVHASYSLLTAGIVPMLAILLLTVTGVDQKLTVHTAIFIAASIGLFLLAYVAFNRIRTDLLAIQQAFRPTQELTSQSEI